MRYTHVLLLILMLAPTQRAAAQINITFTLSHVAEQCAKGAASLSFNGRKPTDSLSVNWSTGETNALQVTNLSGGEHNVRIYLKRVEGNKTFVKDTLVFFTTEKYTCDLVVPPFFSPNDDNINDELQIGNIVHYPNFELEIFNKNGQRVHHQKKDFTPWDAKWLGANLPDGTYYYLLFPDAANKSKAMKGSITILR